MIKFKFEVKAEDTARIWMFAQSNEVHIQFKRASMTLEGIRYIYEVSMPEELRTSFAISVPLVLK